MKKIALLFGGRTGGVLASIVEMLIGVLLLIDPVGFTSGVVVVLGAVVLAVGLWSILSYFRRPVVVAYTDWRLGRGLLMALAGLFCITNSQWVLGVLPALFTVYGLVMLVAGVMKLQHVIDLKRLGNSRWYLAGLSALAYMLIAAIILLNPFGTAMMVWSFVGISMIASAALDLVSLVMAG